MDDAATEADSRARLTRAPLTPGTAPSALSTCATHAAHVMPCTGRTNLCGVALEAADEIALAEFDPIVAQDVVGSGRVEEEVRQRDVAEIREPRMLLHGVAQLERNLARFGAIE